MHKQKEYQSKAFAEASFKGSVSLCELSVIFKMSSVRTSIYGFTDFGSTCAKEDHFRRAKNILLCRFNNEYKYFYLQGK